MVLPSRDSARIVKTGVLTLQIYEFFLIQANFFARFSSFPPDFRFFKGSKRPRFISFVYICMRNRGEIRFRRCISLLFRT